MMDAYWNKDDPFEHDVFELFGQYMSPEEFIKKWKHMIVPPIQSESSVKTERFGKSRTLEQDIELSMIGPLHSLQPIELELLKQECDMYGTELCLIYQAKSKKRGQPCTYGTSHGIKYCPLDLLPKCPDCGGTEHYRIIYIDDNMTEVDFYDCMMCHRHWKPEDNFGKPNDSLPRTNIPSPENATYHPSKEILELRERTKNIPLADFGELDGHPRSTRKKK